MSGSDQALRIAFVQASWHADIVDHSRAACLEELAAHGVAESQVDVFRVPGAFELPLQIRRALRTRRYAAAIAAGLVVDGGIYRHEFVASAVIDGLMRVQLDEDVPVISAVLTPHHFHEHPTHVDFFEEHFRVKGAEAARACMDALTALATVTPSAAA